MLNADLFAEVLKRSEEELKNTFGAEVGCLMKAQSICEEKFAEKNQGPDNKMVKLDHDSPFTGREKREARLNASAVKTQILKLVRIFSRKDMQNLLRKEFAHLVKTNEILSFADSFEDLRSLW